MNKICLGILFGGQSFEHEISVNSAQSVIHAIDKNKYDINLIGIDKFGYWQLTKKLEELIETGSVKSKEQNNFNYKDNPQFIGLHHNGHLIKSSGNFNSVKKLDVVFPILHGTFGEDGTIQGMLETVNVPYVGCGVASSALGMDKALSKKIFEAEKIPQSPYIIIKLYQWKYYQNNFLLKIENELGYPSFVKPAKMGSSIGVKKVINQNQLITAINYAFNFDRTILVEPSMNHHREIECSILGNEDPITSKVGEVIHTEEFYDYETKYLNNQSQLIIPSNLDSEICKTIKTLSVKAFQAINGTGLARVDFFVDKNSNDVFLNEINTMPGLSPKSMYPKLWMESGITYIDLIDKLINLSIEEYQSKKMILKKLH